ncbi:TonB C-terminal domain-containing protein [Bacteriovoracales bacterium]|nr:TonB C-terminal domain-containing protein [Bacteriovoracales bacterium]
MKDFLQEENRETELNINSFFILSSAIHILILFLAYAIDSSFFHSNKPHTKKISSYVRVDVVSMPKLTMNELKKLNLDNSFKKEKVAKFKKAKYVKETLNHKVKKYDIVEISKNEKINQLKKVRRKKKQINKNFAVKQEKNNVLDLIKDLGTEKVKTLKTRSKINYGRNSNIKIGRKSKKIIKNLLIEGNKISKGESLIDGETLSNEEIDLKAFKDYIEKVRASVKEYWKLPEYLKDQPDVRCRIQIFISTNGDLLRLHVYESSGNEEYDKRALQTVENAAPFPSVSFKIRERVLNGDLILGFPL